MNKESVTKKWNKLLNMEIPEIGDNDKFFNLTETNTYSAGCITSYLEGKLDQECITIIKLAIINLKNILPNIDKEEKAYYELLVEILKDIKRQKGF